MKHFLFVMLLSIPFISNALAFDNRIPTDAQAASSASSAPISAIIIKVSEDNQSIAVRKPNETKDIVLTASKGIQDLLSQGRSLSQGDKVTLMVDEKNTVISIKPDSVVRISGQSRLAYLIISAASLFAFTWFAVLIGGGGNILSLIVGEDNRYSNSKFQIAFWFSIVITTYLAVVILRCKEAGGEYLLVNIPQNLLLLSGMSALTYGGAKAITSSKSDSNATQEAAKAVAKSNAIEATAKADGNANQDAQQITEAVYAAREHANSIAKRAGYNAGKPEFFKDLLQNDFGKVDFGDFQMLVVTILAAGVYYIQVYTFMGQVEIIKVVTLPDVDTTILSSFGLGHAAYLTKKYAGNTGES